MGRNAEQLFRLPQPNFEEGYKGPVQVILRRIAQQPLLATHAPQIADSLLGLFLSPEIQRLKERIIKHSDSSDPASVLVRKNTIFLPNEIFLRASPFHLDNWLRDSFITCLSLNDPVVEKHLLNNFVRRRNRTNHVPTNRLFASDRAWYFDDESTALSLIWRTKLANLGYPLEQKEVQTWTDIFNWIQSHDRNGFYVTSAGTEKSWFDTFVFREEDTITYNQGVYAVAVRAAKQLGLSVDDDQIEEAVRAYNRLTHASGRLQLSNKVPYIDVSALFGEFLSNFLFEQSILDGKIVEKTIKSLPRDNRYGYNVVTREDGSYLDPAEFNRPYQPGDYHNGADWPLFNMIAQTVVRYHGLSYDRHSLIEGLRLLFETRNAEYIKTGGMTIIGEPIYNPARTNHTWNAACYALAKQLLGIQEYKSALELINSEPKGTLFSEANQLPGSSL